jgi:hypothetical protein
MDGVAGFALAVAFARRAGVAQGHADAGAGRAAAVAALLPWLFDSLA